MLRANQAVHQAVDARATPNETPIKVVDGGCVHANEYFVGPRRRLIDLTERQRLRRAILSQQQRFHVFCRSNQPGWLANFFAGDLPGYRYYLWLLRITNFSPDQVSLTAHTLIST